MHNAIAHHLLTDAQSLTSGVQWFFPPGFFIKTLSPGCILW